MISNREEQWGLSTLKTGSHVYPSSSMLLSQSSVTKKGKVVLSMEPGTGVKPMAKKGAEEWRKEGM